MDYLDGPNPNIHKQEGFHKEHHLQPKIFLTKYFLKEIHILKLKLMVKLKTLQYYLDYVT